MHTIYLDHAASTPLHPEALKDLESFFKHDFANPSSAHLLGRRLLEDIERARQVFQKLLSAQTYQVVFTSSATESNNSVFHQFDWAQTDEVYISEADHPSVTMPAKKILATRVGSIGPKTRLAILSWVNNASGEVLDVVSKTKELKRLNPEIWVHVDGVQGFSKFALDLDRSGIDSLTICAHKLGGPKGVAALLTRKEIRPLLWGGGQELSQRASTQNAPLIKCFARQAERMMGEREKNYVHVSRLAHRIVRELGERETVDFPFAFNPYILTCIFKSFPSAVMLRHLEAQEIYISSSSACSSKKQGPNPVFASLGIDSKWHQHILRISLSAQNTGEEVENFISSFKAIEDDLICL